MPVKLLALFAVHVLSAAGSELEPPAKYEISSLVVLGCGPPSISLFGRRQH